MVHFNPLTPCGVRQHRTSTAIWEARFQSTHPMRGETAAAIRQDKSDNGFQSTHPMRGETLEQILSVRRKKISIHSPHAG